MMNKSEFFESGWCRFNYDPNLQHWVSQALPQARKAIGSKAGLAMLRCGGTWQAGINVLPNRADGSVGSSGKLNAEVVDFIRQHLGLADFDWDSAQVSVCYPGYPQPMGSESSAAFQYRRNRDAAHVDGLLPEGPRRRRHLREYHGFILGIPLVEFSRDASPFVVWEGSHEIVRAAFLTAFESIPADDWGERDVTEIYHQTRQRVFESCKRVEIQARPGEAYLIHRLALHGMAPWGPGAEASADGRMICYFRPDIGGPEEWLNMP